MARLVFGDLREQALARYCIPVDYDGNLLGIDGSPLVVEGALTMQEEAPVFGDMHLATMGNAGPLVVVPANANRRGLYIRNNSDTTGYFTIGSDTNLAVGTCIFHLAAGQTMPWNTGAPTQAVYAVCGAADKQIGYQEGV